MPVFGRHVFHIESDMYQTECATSRQACPLKSGSSWIFPLAIPAASVGSAGQQRAAAGSSGQQHTPNSFTRMQFFTAACASSWAQVGVSFVLVWFFGVLCFFFVL